MRKLFGALASLSLLTSPVLAEPEIKEWKTFHSLGCMIMRECTKDVYKLSSTKDMLTYYPDLDISGIEREMDDLIAEFNRIGVGVYVADGKYFPRLHRGVYYTVGNDFFLNIDYLNDPETVLEVTRHEGWHAVQDCMAGTIINSNIAIVWNDGVVPEGYQLRADIAYGGNPKVVPWEAEAMWAAEEPYQTVNALKACNHPEGDIWEIYEPTPMTREWLIDNGFLNN